MRAPDDSMVKGQAVMMLISAALFGYFGFLIGWNHRYTLATATEPARLLVMVALLMWSLRIGAAGFLVSAVLAMVGSTWSMLLYALIGLTTALVFLAVAVWDWRTPQYYSGVHWGLLIIFAAWNGYSSATLLRDWFDLTHSDDGPSAD